MSVTRYCQCRWRNDSSLGVTEATSDI